MLLAPGSDAKPILPRQSAVVLGPYSTRCARQNLSMQDDRQEGRIQIGGGAQ